jgi:autotransporter-associated beta strand protein
MLLPPRWGYSAPFTSALTGGGTLNLTVDFIRDYFGGDWSAFTGQINVSPRSGTGDFRIDNNKGYAGTSFYLNNGVNFYNINANNQTTDLGELGGATGAYIGLGSLGSSNPTWRIGAKNTSSTYAGVIADSGITSLIKIGTGTLILAGANTYSGFTTISNGTLQIGNNGTTGTVGTNNIINRATLAFQRSDTIGYGGVIGGPGKLAQRGDGTLVLTNVQTYTGITTIESGTLALVGVAAIAGSPGIDVSFDALLDVSGRTGGGLTLASGQTLSGNGAVKGNFTVASGAKLSPGNSFGTLTFSNALTLSAGSLTTLEISHAALAHDQLNVQGNLLRGGTLVVTNLGGNSLAAGDSFPLLNTPSLTGSFNSLVLPPLGPNLAWDTNTFNDNGTLSIISTLPPVFGTVATLGDGNFRLTFTGPTGQDYEIRASTNLALVPVTLWDLLSSGTFGNTPIMFDDLSATNHWQRFYRIVVP